MSACMVPRESSDAPGGPRRLNLLHHRGGTWRGTACQRVTINQLRRIRYNQRMRFIPLAALLLVWTSLIGSEAVAADAPHEAPLRVFIRAGAKTHGPGQHDHPRFLKEWTALLNGRG